jgi:signal transduction histidine kinase
MPTDDFIAFCFIVFVILRKAPQRVETRVICQRRAAASQAMECIQPTGARLQGGVVEFDPGMLSYSNHSAQIRFQIGNRRALPFPQLSVSDNGSGLDAKMLPHIFALFTTKAMG